MSAHISQCMCNDCWTRRIAGNAGGTAEIAEPEPAVTSDHEILAELGHLDAEGRWVAGDPPGIGHAHEPPDHPVRRRPPPQGK